MHVLQKGVVKVSKNDIVCLCEQKVRGIEYLSGFESCLYGDVYLPYTSLKPSQALPLSPVTAQYLLGKFEFDVRKHFDVRPYPKCDLVENFLDL